VQNYLSNVYTLLLTAGYSCDDYNGWSRRNPLMITAGYLLIVPAKMPRSPSVQYLVIISCRVLILEN